eukprot:GFKZ01000378.1.p1 GENE.GFKZ01000378.1~~GFKZ01000378.1.p1  ORF type:complete len:1825 (+),score=234.55 GFKZ01000378.1:194-5668(+)
MSSAYDTIRSAVLSQGSDSRVEVNQRALIDKILARYASANAVYRELLQNSNDAEASQADIQFHTTPTPTGSFVTQVVYRNNGKPFAHQDWARLRKIAEGNPDVSKVGAFGVGAYTMFSICEQPMVVSGGSAMTFAWKGDALWVKLGKIPGEPDQWTSFVLPSRDPYVLPSLTEFGAFICSSLTFTACLKHVSVYVDGTKRLAITKRNLHDPRVIVPKKASSWWTRDGAVITSPEKFFTFDRTDGAITETVVQMTAELDGETSIVHARYVSALATTRVPTTVARRMERVTKKKHPSEVKIEIFIDADSKKPSRRDKGPAAAITDEFAPRLGAGRVFIGFKTSQTTGLAAHLAAPLLPTVEREAIDFQDPALMLYNCELLAVAGILMRLTLEHSMSLLDERWKKGEPERRAFEEAEQKKAKDAKPEQRSAPPSSTQAPAVQAPEEEPPNPLFSFARFMSSKVKKIADVISNVELIGDSTDDDLLNPPDTRPLSEEERDAILLMRSFSPELSTPDPKVGAVLAKGFEICFPRTPPPVLTKTGVKRGADCRLPFRGIEGFVKDNVVRAVILKNAESYLRNVAGCQELGLHDLLAHLGRQPIETEDLARLLRWWIKFCRHEDDFVSLGMSLKQNISFLSKDEVATTESAQSPIVAVLYLRDIQYYIDESTFENGLPMPASVLPKSLRAELPTRILKDRVLQSWFAPLSVQVWARFICSHSSLTQGKAEEEGIRLQALATLSREHQRLNGASRALFMKSFANALSQQKCIPVQPTSNSNKTTDFPGDLYLSSAELAIFDGLGSFSKVSPALAKAGVTDEFLVALGVRKTISMDFLFTQLDRLKWNRDPMPLVSYLRSVTLTSDDLTKLRTTQYLPEVQDKSRTYAPSELCLPNPDLKDFPFVKVLQWPSPQSLHPSSPDALFLQKLGCAKDPPLELLMNFLVNQANDKTLRERCLVYIYNRLLSQGPYLQPYRRFLGTYFLPAVRHDPLSLQEPQKEIQSPNSCYSNKACACMGVPVLDPALSSKFGRGFAEVLQCASDPSAQILVKNLMTVVANAKRLFVNGENASNEKLRRQVLDAFSSIFKYMSSRSMDLDGRTAGHISKTSFIPSEVNGTISWYRPDQVYFEDGNRSSSDIVANLFPITKFSPFLAAVGVKREPSNEDILRLLISSPEVVLEKLGDESRYRSLLRRIAASKPYKSVTTEMRKSAFLLGYRVQEPDPQNNLTEKPTSDGDDNSKKKAICTLAKADDICIIDNSHFSRLFNALSAPQESDLENFYLSLGSSYISKKVNQNFVSGGGQQSDTAITKQFRARIKERRPLLTSSIMSRPLVPKAALLLNDENLEVFEVSRIKAMYTLGNETKTEFVTCSARNVDNRKLSLFITKELDWFHVGNAIGSVILVRCNVQDAFFIGSLLEAPLSQLRVRGFPVDRILRSSEPVAVKKEPSRELRKHLEGNAEMANGTSSTPSLTDTDGFVEILAKMYPDCREDYIRQLLGNQPTLESLKSVDEQLRTGKYPQKVEKPLPRAPTQGARNPPAVSPGGNSFPGSQKRPQADSSKPAQPHLEERRKHGSIKNSAGNVLNRAFRGLRGAKPLVSPNGSNSKPNVFNERPSSQNSPGSEEKHPNDAATHSHVSSILKNSIRSSRPAPSNGISSREQELVSVPESLERDVATCEVIPGQDLRPFSGPYGTGRTSTGIRVFASIKSSENKYYLESNWQIVETFASVLIRLCQVYSLGVETVSIFYEATRRTIAFNSNRSLFFNLRYFANLHYVAGTAPDLDCYSYWFTTMSHELAHNMVSAHGKQHGFYTESYVSEYMPKLLQLLSTRWNPN